MKIEIDLPIRAVDYVDQNIEILGDEKGVQLNIIYDGVCTHRLTIDKDFMFHLTDHNSGDTIHQYDLLSDLPKE